jgi:hypothetical protein
MRAVWMRSRWFGPAMILLTMSFGLPAANAQQPLEVPPPAPQSQPSFRPRPAPTARPQLPQSQQLQEIPQVSTPTPSPPTVSPAPQMPPVLPPPALPRPSRPSSSMLQTQPVLPAVFRGCWDGRVEFLDSNQQMWGAPKVGVWTPKTYRICYRRVGNGPFELTFSQVGMDPNTKVVNPTGQMELVSTDGHNAATMRALLHFDEYYTNRRMGNRMFAVDEEAILSCVVQVNGAMLVRGQVFGRRNGAPWFRAAWHAVFSRVGGLPE